ncbi:MAG: protein kinase domain-containing protein [Gemmataceae bacterium]
MDIAAMVRADQQARWQRGQHVLVEDYMVQLAHLPFHDEAVLDLIYQEILLREARGETPRLAEYCQRFPHLDDPLRDQFALQAALQADSLAAPSASAPLLTKSLQPLDPEDVHNWSTISYEITPDEESSAQWRRVAIPEYEILGELGQGGMGVVYKARHLGLQRIVALKMILAGAQARSQERNRFLTEARAVARLQHPHIVQVYDIGEHEGVPYFSLEYVVGGTLANRIAGRPQPPRAAAEMVEKLARAVQVAHEHHIIHRDLKPANVLLTKEGHPKITDFGLAKQLDVEFGQTRSGAIMGTPSYMAPEQASGNVKDIGPATDVYSLGAILYEMLTGSPPFKGATAMDTLWQVSNETPVPLNRLQAKVPLDLETICMKCLEKEPSKRYASAEALAEDLRAFLMGEAIQARAPGKIERVARWARQRPTLAALSAAAAVAMIGLLVGILLYSALAVSAVAILSLLLAGAWYNARLQKALRELKQQQVEAERNVERLHLMLETTRKLVSTTDLDALLKLIGETSTRFVNAERATIYLVDKKRGELWSKVAMGDGVGTIRIPIGVGIAGTVAATGEPISIPDAYNDPRFNQDIDKRTGYRTRNLLTYPMKRKGREVVGVFQVLNKRSGPFGPEDMATLAMLAESALIVVEKAIQREQDNAAGEGA